MEKPSHPLKGNNDLLSITARTSSKKSTASIFEGRCRHRGNQYSGTTIAQTIIISKMPYTTSISKCKIAKEVADDMTAKEPHKPFCGGGAKMDRPTVPVPSPGCERSGFSCRYFRRTGESLLTLNRPGADWRRRGHLLWKPSSTPWMPKLPLFAINPCLKISERISVHFGNHYGCQRQNLSGQTTEAFLISLSHVPLFFCWSDWTAPWVQRTASLFTNIVQKKRLYISAYPNAGLPKCVWWLWWNTGTNGRSHPWIF